MTSVGQVKAVRFVRRLRGGSNPFLLEASDGFLYVVKRQGNPQGCNLLFNEAMGSEIFRRAGLPVPEWRVVELSNTLEIPASAGEGRSILSNEYCFGSRYVDPGSATILEILPKSSFCRIRNRRDLWAAWVLDSLCEHTDNRQAIFLEHPTRHLDAYFVDHGHLFGGACGDGTPSLQGCRYLDPRIYQDVLRGWSRQIYECLRGIDLNALNAVADLLPEGWGTASGRDRLRSFCERMSHPSLLRNTVRSILGTARPERTWDYGARWVPSSPRGLYARLP